jgi:hypothetical protein
MIGVNMSLNSLVALFQFLTACVTVDGQGAHFWDDSVVVYVKVLDVTHKQRDSYTIKLEPIASLTGNLDPAITGELDSQAYILRGQRVIQFKPVRNSRGIVLLKRDESGKYSIPDVGVRFFPYLEPLQYAPGFDHESVTKIIEDLQKLRGKHGQESEKPPSTGKARAILAEEHPKERRAEVVLFA